MLFTLLLVELIIILLTHLLIKLKKFLESHIRHLLIIDLMLKILFQKTGSTRQSELIALLVRVTQSARPLQMH